MRRSVSNSSDFFTRIPGAAGLRWAARPLHVVSAWLPRGAAFSWGWRIQDGFTAMPGTWGGWPAARLLPLPGPLRTV